MKRQKENILIPELTGNIVDNVKYLCEKKGIKVSEIEEAFGSKHGYFNGAKQKGNSPSIEKVAIAAQKLEVTIDDLCYGDFERNELKNEIAEYEAKLAEAKKKLEGKN